MTWLPYLNHLKTVWSAWTSFLDQLNQTFSSSLLKPISVTWKLRFWSPRRKDFFPLNHKDSWSTGVPLYLACCDIFIKHLSMLLRPDLRASDLWLPALMENSLLYFLFPKDQHAPHLSRITSALISSWLMLIICDPGESAGFVRPANLFLQKISYSGWKTVI